MKIKNLFQKFAVAAIAAAIVLGVAMAALAQTAPKQEKLLNGLKILLWNDAGADKVTVKLRIHSGSAFDPQGKEGVMQLLADNIFPTNASREFFTEDLGGGLEVAVNYDYIQINASSKPEHFLTMLETLSAAVSNPAIDKETTAKLRTALLAKIKNLEADPAYVADQAVAKRLFGTFPYGRPQLGTSESVQKIDFADLIDARQRFLTADNATIAISGNFETPLALKAIRRYFGGWLKSDRRVPSTFRQPDDPANVLLAVASPVPDVATFRFAFRGPARSDKDLAASLIFTKILENRLISGLSPASATNISVSNEYHLLPGLITLGFSPVMDKGGWRIGKVEANALVAKVMGDQISESEYQIARSSIQALWSKKDSYQFWLDVDTYKITNPDSQSQITNTVTYAEVNAYADKVRKLPLVSILVNTPPTN